MTYFGFLIRFLFIPIIIMLVVTYFDNRARRPTPGFDGKKVSLIIGVHVLLALVYTTPWDNYLVATGVWTYNPALVTGLVFGYVPIEEYTFFIVETIFAGLWWWFLARRIKPSRAEIFRANKQLIYYATALLVITWLIFTTLFFFGAEKWNYLGITVFWALPAIFPQLLFGADILWHHRKLVALTIVPLAFYLSIADVFALTAGTWTISATQTIGEKYGNVLPVEEAVFFLVTSIMISFGMTLMLSDLGRERFNNWKTRGFKGLP